MKKTLLTIASLLAGAALISACSAAPSNDVLGAWGDTETRGEPSLVFEDDGSVHGNDGCNNIMGSYTVDGNSVEFGPLASTMMFCEGVDEWLGKATTATASGDTLTLFDEAGTEIGALLRAN